MTNNVDEVRRRVILQEWIDELKISLGVIENDSLEKSGLVAARNEITNRLEAIISFAESKMPGFDPLDDIVCVQAKVTTPARRSAQQGRSVHVHKRRSD